MTRKRKPYCPYNGCGMPNGAAPPVPVKCKICGYGDPLHKLISLRGKLTNFDKYCPICQHCISCQRLVKKFYQNPEPKYKPFS